MTSLVGLFVSAHASAAANLPFGASGVRLLAAVNAAAAVASALAFLVMLLRLAERSKTLRAKRRLVESVLVYV